MSKRKEKLDKKAYELAQEIESARRAMERAKSLGDTQTANNMWRIMHRLEKEATN